MWRETIEALAKAKPLLGRGEAAKGRDLELTTTRQRSRDGDYPGGLIGVADGFLQILPLWGKIFFMPTTGVIKIGALFFSRRICYNNVY